MLSKERIVTGLNAVADQVEALCSEHEADSHGGNMCISNRLAALAFMAHRLGVQPGILVTSGGSSITVDEAFWAMVDDYAENYPHCNGEGA